MLTQKRPVRPFCKPEGFSFCRSVPFAQIRRSPEAFLTRQVCRSLPPPSGSMACCSRSVRKRAAALSWSRASGGCARRVLPAAGGAVPAGIGRRPGRGASGAGGESAAAGPRLHRTGAGAGAADAAVPSHAGAGSTARRKKPERHCQQAAAAEIIRAGAGASQSQRSIRTPRAGASAHRRRSGAAAPRAPDCGNGWTVAKTERYIDELCAKSFAEGKA